MNKEQSTEDDLEFIRRELGDVFERMKNRNTRDIDVERLNVSALRTALGATRLRRSMERDAA